MTKSKKRSESGSSKEGILATTKRSNFDLEDDDFEDMCRGFVPNTAANTKNCLRLFQSWGQARNLHFSSDEVPADIQLMDDHALLVKWLCRFSTEACKIDGEPYPPKTLQHYDQFHCLAINKLHYSHFKAAPSLTAPFKSAQVTAMLTSLLTLTFKTFLITDVLCTAVILF